MKITHHNQTQSSFKIIKKFSIPVATVMLLTTTRQAEAHDNSYIQASYAFTLNMAQSIEELEPSYTIGYDIRWLLFRSRILALTGEYNSAISSLYNRAAYQQTRVGVQYYPLALGLDFQNRYESTIMTYTSFLKPYLGANVGFGRFLIKPQSSEDGGYELSTDHVIIGGSIGANLQFRESFAADLAADTGYVLPNSAIGLNGLVIRVRTGLMLAF